MFHSVDYSPTGLKSYCSIIYANKFWNNELNLQYSTSLPFNITSRILIGQDVYGYRCCAKISNVKMSLLYFNSNYVTSFMSDIYGKLMIHIKE